jgi:glucans biosynthesis protein
MSIDPSRRHFLQALAALGLLSAGSWPRLVEAMGGKTASGLRFGPVQAFSFEWLRAQAKELAAQPYHAQPIRHSDLLDKITYDVYQQIRFRERQALQEGHTFPIQFFHLGKYARESVAIHAVSGGQARQVLYSPALFDYEQCELTDPMPTDLGFAGFRAMNNDDVPGDWLAFMGASYFRTAGPLNQYGLSARGIAINTVVPFRSEEFPRFTAFWLEAVTDDPDSIMIYAMLDGPSITGAYRMRCNKRATITMDIHADLFQRESIKQLGVAPLTSMYWYSETNARIGDDWRPEIHDSDGLAMWTGSGERILRPLNNPASVQTNSFFDDNPRGFGLLQRDRNFAHYLDDGVFYDRRASVWVEPHNGWGRGSVVLVEIPTNDEIEDNIVAFWQPEREAGAGAEWALDYTLHWVSEEPYIPPVARVVHTRLGRPGAPGQHEARDPHGRKFVIEFIGGPFADMEQRFDLEAVISASRGTLGKWHVLKILGTDRWRAEFDLQARGPDPIDLRCYLRLGDKTLTETWLYQYLPGNYGFRA